MGKKESTEHTFDKNAGHFNKMVEVVQDYAILLLNKDGNIISWNSGAEKIKGFTANEIIGRHFSVFYTPEDINAQVPAQLLEHAIQNGKSEHEGWRIRKDGSTFWASVVITAEYDANGTVTGFLKITRDLTGQKTNREQLKEYTEKLEQKNEEVIRNAHVLTLILNSMGEGVAAADINGRFFIVNPKAVEIWGRRPDEINPVEWSAYYGIFYPDEKTPFPPEELAMVRAINGLPSEKVEIFIRNPKIPAGKHITVTGTPVRNEEGKVIAGVIVMSDVTERRKNEQNLREANYFLNTILENIPNMIFVKEADELRFVRFNKAGENLLGFKRDELMGKNDYDFFPKEQADFFTEKDREVLRNNKLLDIPEEPIDTNNGPRWLHTKKIPVRNEQGVAKFLMGISEDITEAKKRDDLIKELNTELEKSIAQLRISNKELESFAYSVAHDLRTPLRAIHGYTSILMEEYIGKLDDEAKRLMTNVLKNTRKMGGLIDELLAFSHISRKDLNKDVIDMNALVNETLTELLVQENGRQIEIKQANLPPAYADVATLKQVWANLLSNAVKYTRHKQPAVIEIGATENEHEITYFVKDNGVGFDMKYADKLFGVFQRLHSNEEFEGTGVGLAIVHRIIEKHGGKIWADATLNHGANFYFSLPKQ